ncbi:hypothetical protein JVT61DRAFT_3737 [Boletus reticuloceps]|uniref:Uncharacterized protein n=1 Tax=Boletus reticuloceps TaxID=495285 RepID=A0A8I2YPZ8_9AGAM|nr:hypothetical protein JVT61DRAFT_3737 [Boletus reticuloceps]
MDATIPSDLSHALVVSNVLSLFTCLDALGFLLTKKVQVMILLVKLRKEMDFLAHLFNQGVGSTHSEILSDKNFVLKVSKIK